MRVFVKQRKRVLAGAMALLMVLSTILSYDIVAFAASTTTTIAAWEQTSLDDPTVVPYESTTGEATLNLVGALPSTFSSSNKFASKGWNVEDAYWLMQLSTTSYENITFSAYMKASNTGPQNVQLQYSIDEGNTWTSVGTEITLTATRKQVFNAVSLPAAVSNQESVWIRIQKSSETSVNGGTIQEAGTCSLGDIVIKGDTLGTGSVDNDTDVDVQPTSEPVATSTPVVDSSTEEDTVVEDNANMDFEVETGIQLQLAKWSGNGNSGDAKVIYADLDSENDYLDTTSSISLSNGNVPLLSNTSTTTGGTTYSLGAKGLLAGQYYLFETTSDKYANISLSFSMKGSKTAPKTFDVSYSRDGKNFTFVETLTLSEASKYETLSTTLPLEASNAKKLYIRLTAGSADFSGNAPGTGATNYIQNISITANPIIADDVTGIVNITPDAGEVKLNQALEMSSKTEGATIYYSIDGGEEKVYDENNKPVLTTLPAVVTTYAVSADKEDSLKVTYAYTQAQVATVKASPNGGAITKNTKITLTTTTEDATISYSYDGITWNVYNDEDKVTMNELPGTLYVKAEKEGWLESSRVTLSFTERVNEEYGLYFGQLHSHTNLSDGSGEVEEAFAYAKEANQIDFLAVTDHSNSFDGIDSASILSAEDSAKWERGHQAAEDATDDTFVGIYGFEMTWSNGLGHMNTFNTEGFQSRTQTAFSSYATALQNYYLSLKTDTSSISQFNHPGTTYGDFSDFAYYDEEIDSLITLIEVGNGEGAIGSTGYFPSFEYYTRALDKGWHVAPTISQDNHKGRWGDANTGRTVVLADVLDEENIYDALRNKRVYATEDNDLEIRYTLDGNVMGTELDIDAVGDTVKLEVELNDPTDASMGTVQVIVNGGLVVASQTLDTNEGTVEFELPSSYSYYYIKVIQADGEIAVTAPVWVGEVEAVGISSVSTETSLPVQGEAVDVTLEMYNNESSDLIIESIEYSVDDEVVHTVNLEEAGMTKVSSMSTSSYTFDFMNEKAGAVNLNVEVKATLNGVEKIYNGLLKLDYVVPSMVTNIVVDGTHYNDYVTGYYGGNMSNFAALASTSSAKVTIVTDEITDEILADCDLLVVSAPAKKSGTANAGAYEVSSFEPEFISRVKNYTDNGGSIVVCGMADYQDTTSGQSSTEINKLLEAIGSTVTINSDQMQDNDNNGGQSYRLYFTEFNQESSLLEGTVEGQTYSAYSGCSVNITNATEDTATAKAAEWLVKGHETTYSLNTKAEDGSYIASTDYTTVVEAGNVVAAASQELAGGGTVIVTGTVFVSDFEVEAELDNAWDVPYANRTIAENLIAQIKAQLPISTIAEAREGALGDVYRIQGRVTAGTAVEANSFFDAIYVQDETGGITIFPFAESGLEVGSLVEIIGYVDEYQGDKELQIMESTVIDAENLVEVQPTKMSAKDAMDYDNNGGQLIQVEGTITEVETNGNTVSQFRVKDDNGDIATVFIDGYITSGSGNAYDLSSFVKVGNKVSAVGLLYKHPEGDSDESVACLRVRNTEEIVLVTDTPSEDKPSVDTPVVDKPTTNTPSTETTVTVGKVSGLKVASRSTTAVKLSWTKVSGATGYRVGYYLDGKWTYKDVTTNTFTHKSLSAATKVSYKVYAYKVVNGKKTYGTVSTTLKTATNPAKTTVSTSSSTTSIKVSYKAIKGVSGYQVAQYKNGKWVTVKTVSSSKKSVTISGLKAGTTYKFKVRGYVTVNGKKIYGSYSSVAKTATKTKTPAISSIKTSSKKVTLSWKKVSGADGYVVYKYNASTKKYVKVKTIKKSTTLKYTQTGLKSGTTVKYKVRAYKKVGSKTVYSAYSSVKSIKVK